MQCAHAAHTRIWQQLGRLGAACRTSSSVFLQALAEGLEGCLRPHSEKVGPLHQSHHRCREPALRCTLLPAQSSHRVPACRHPLIHLLCPACWVWAQSSSIGAATLWTPGSCTQPDMHLHHALSPALDTPDPAHTPAAPALKGEDAQVMDSAFMFVMGRPRPAAQQPPPPAAEAAPSGGPSPTRLEAAESCFVQPVLASLKPRKAWDWDCYDSCAPCWLIASPLAALVCQLMRCSRLAREESLTHRDLCLHALFRQLPFGGPVCLLPVCQQACRAGLPTGLLPAQAGPADDSSNSRPASACRQLDKLCASGAHL